MISVLTDTDLQELRNFKADTIHANAMDKINVLAKKIRKDILAMTMKAASGHIGGSLSSADVYLMLWLCANSTPDNQYDVHRDRIVISHGHTSPGVYAVLGNFHFFDIHDAVENFRKKNSVFEGHPSCQVPGVEWGSGSLGQGLSVGCGFALASKLQHYPNRVFVVMGDGEQQKGQLSEARAFARKYKLNNLSAIIDMNNLQASGNTASIMPGDIAKIYEAACWEVITIDGHDYHQIYEALKYTSGKEKPVAILANTVMSKGVSFIENNYEYHGKLLSKSQHEAALTELGGNEMPVSLPAEKFTKRNNVPVDIKINAGHPILYSGDTPVECRTAAGEAIYDIIKNNTSLPIVVVDCDLVESVKTQKVLTDFPHRFIQCGIQEHNAATVSGALSKAGIIPFFLDFGVFGIDETYGQHRMNDMNGTAVKLIATHCGLDVGEDGKTHQCIDYISLINNLPGYKLIIPADANQTDRVIRYIATTPGNFVVAVGRSKVPVIKNTINEPFYDASYSFNYGSAEWLREGKDAVIITTGTMVYRAIQAADELLPENIGASVLNISCPAAIDPEIIKTACCTGVIITYEDHFIQSGLGSIIASIIAENGWACRFKKMGVVSYGKSCSAAEQYPLQGLDVNSLKTMIKRTLQTTTSELVV